MKRGRGGRGGAQYDDFGGFERSGKPPGGEDNFYRADKAKAEQAKDGGEDKGAAD